jgi:outer membrane lipoprotein-sorting protein
LAQKQAAPSSPNEVSSLPPFSTKEPDHYQATRIMTSIDNDGVQAPRVTRVLIARQGERRREDYDSDSDLRTTYLEIPAGTFVLLPSKKLYADIKAGSATLALANQQADQQADFSPEALLNEPTAARYEKLGSEKLDGRTATKYRVTNPSTNGTEVQTVTLIWIDEALGMPIRSETETSDSTHHSKLTMELRDIRSQVDPGLFELPKDYRKVEYSELPDWLKQTRAGGSNGSPKP